MADSPGVVGVPRPLIEALTEAKDVSELMVDLAFGSVFYSDAELAQEVVELERDLAGILHEMRESAGASSARDEESASLINLTGAIEIIGRQAVDIAKVVLRGLGIPAELRAELAAAAEVVHRVQVSEDAEMAGRRLDDLSLPQRIGMRVLAIHGDNDAWRFAPGGEDVVSLGDVVVARGAPRGVAGLRSLAGAPPVVETAVGARGAFSDLQRAVDTVVEMKNLAEVSVGLAYAALQYEDRSLAQEVSRLEDQLDGMRDQLEVWVLQTSRAADDDAQLRGLLRLAVSVETIGDAAQSMVWPVERGERLHPILREAFQQTDDIVTRATVELGSEVEGRSLSNLELRARMGFTVLALRRGGTWTYRPQSSTVLLPGDELVLTGPSGRSDAIPSFVHAGVPSITDLEDAVHDALGRPGDLADAVRAAHPADVASVIDRLPESRRMEVFAVLPPRRAAEALAELSHSSIRLVLESLPADEAARLLDMLPMDDAAHVLAQDVPELRQKLLERMGVEDAHEVRDLLAYPPKSAGRLMTERFVSVSAEMSVAEAIDHLRVVDDEVETMTDLFIVDSGGRLQGVVPLRRVVVAPPSTPLSSLAVRDPVTVTPDTDQEDVGRLAARYDFVTLPVVSEDGTMRGVITVDDVIDVLVEESTEDVVRFGGVEMGDALNQPYFTVPIGRVVTRRFVPLLLLFAAASLTGSVLRYFEDELARVVALSFFLPLVIGTGGNTGAQTVSTLIRGLSRDEVIPRDALRVVRREMLGGVLLGSLLGTVGFGLALLWHTPLPLACVVGATLVVVCAWANTAGAVIPLVARKLRLDPAHVSAPLITTVVDATGLAIYMLIAKALLRL